MMFSLIQCEDNNGYINLRGLLKVKRNTLVFVATLCVSYIEPYTITKIFNV